MIALKAKDLTEIAFTKPLGAFAPARSFPYQIIGSASFNGKKLVLDFKIQGDHQLINFGNLAPTHTRQSHLWEKTCFEAFLGVPRSKKYYEINCAPSLDWNLFSFEYYRHGMKEELTVHAPKASFDPPGFRAEFDLNRLFSSQSPVELEVSLTTVILATDGEIHYFAWKHSASQPDFHQRKSFFPLL